MIDDFISLFFPRYCLGCRGPLLKGEDNVCLNCYSQVEKTSSHLNPDNFIIQKFYGKVNLVYGWAYFTYLKQGIVQQLLHSLKYDNQPNLAVELGQRYASLLVNSETDLPFEVLVPVPLHFSKLKLRGYNQSEMFANGLSEILKIPVLPHALKRSKATSTQTKKSRFERWTNVDQIFEVNNFDLVDKHVLLVDDVITTGSTLESCAQALINGGAKAVSVIGIAAAK